MPLEGFDDVELPDDTPQRGGWEKSGNGGIAKPIDYAAVERASSIGCTRDEIAAVIGVSRATLFSRIDDDPLVTEAIERGANKGKATLRRFQWQRAAAGSDTMCVWLGKQLLGQRDDRGIQALDKDGKPTDPKPFVLYGHPEAPDAEAWRDEWLKNQPPQP